MAWFALGLALVAAEKRPDLLIADFEGATYGDWRVEGEAFGSGPAPGTLPGQMPVSGFAGKRLANSYHGRDGSVGVITSPAFRIERPWINFLVGGGGYAGETCINLLVDGKPVRTATGPNTKPGGSEALLQESWDVGKWLGQSAVIEIVDRRKGGWGHVNVDQIVQSDTRSAPELVVLEKHLTVGGSHLIVPVANHRDARHTLVIGVYEGGTLVQDFKLALPRENEPFWAAAYPLAPLGLKPGAGIRIAPVDGRRAPQGCAAAFDRIRIGTAADGIGPDDYKPLYRNRFHLASRRGWNNDPNGMVFHNGRYHLYYQHNPFGIFWGNMHWAHSVSTNLIDWEARPLALFQKTVKDMAFSGGGFVDFNNSSGLGAGTLFVSFTSTGRGECLAYSTDGGTTLTELPENPVIEHRGRDPRVLWFEPEKKWVMVVYDQSACAETEALPPTETTKDRALANFAFYESRDLREWKRTGAFTDPDRHAVFECPEMFQLPVHGQPGESRWILYGAQNRYFIGRFDGRTFHKESGPHGSRHGDFYAAQTFSDAPGGRRIQVGWVRTASYEDRFPDQIVNQAFTLPHELTLHRTGDGLRVFFNPARETDQLRTGVIAHGVDLSVAGANRVLQSAVNELSEVIIEFAGKGPKELLINGINAGFNGRTARIFTDRTCNEVYAEGGYYEVRKREPKDFASTETRLSAAGVERVKSVTIHRLRSIWPE